MSRIRLIRAVLIVLLVLTLLFIWHNSMQNRDESSAFSGRVLEIIADAAQRLGIELDRENDHWLRKLAHFAEFSLLGAELALLMLAYERFGARGVCACLLAGLLAAAIDETIQLFTGRGASVRDVLLDFSGVTFAAAAVSAIHLLKRRRGKRSNRPNSN